MRSFFRSVMRRQPSSSSWPMSPVWSQPPSSASRGRLGQVVVAAHDAAAAQQDLAVRGDAHLGPREGWPDGPDARSRRPVAEARGRGLGEAVSLEDEDAGGVEELGHVAGERRAAGDEELELPAEEGPDLPEDEPVRDGVTRREEGARALPPLRRPRHLEAHAHRPSEDRLLHRPALAGVLEHLVADLLEDARHGAHEGRANRGQVLDDLLHAAVDRRWGTRSGAAPPPAPCRRSGPAAARSTAGAVRAAGCPRPRWPRPRRPSSRGSAPRPWAGRWSRRCR